MTTNEQILASSSSSTSLDCQHCRTQPGPGISQNVFMAGTIPVQTEGKTGFNLEGLWRVCGALSGSSECRV